MSPPWCARCGDPCRTWRAADANAAGCARCRSDPPDFDQARAFGLYEGALRQIVHALKYRGHQSLGAPLGALMRAAGRAVLTDADAVVPVPLHPWRQLQRGFNQADELARTLGLPVWRPLRRRRLGLPQAGLRVEHRRANVRGAYTLTHARRWTGSRVPRRVVLVDDVMTTGATLDACSRVLRETGVEWISALTVARTVTRTANRDGAALRSRRPTAPRPSPPHH